MNEHDDFVRTYIDMVYGTCRRILGNDQDAADATQEVFIKWLAGRERIRDHVAGWLHATAHGTAVDHMRRGIARRRAEAGAAVKHADVAEPSNPLHEHLDDALSSLPADARALLVEHHLAGIGQVELARHWQLSQTSISRRLEQARGLLAAALRKRRVEASASHLAGAWAIQRAVCPAHITSAILAQVHVAGVAVIKGSAGLAWWHLWWGKMLIMAGSVLLIAVPSVLLGTSSSHPQVASPRVMAEVHPPPPASSDASSVVEQAISLGFPDASGAKLSMGWMVVHAHSGVGDREYRFEGFHAQLRDGSWMVSLTWPLRASATVRIDTSHLIKVDTSDLIMEEDRDYSHREFRKPWPKLPPLDQADAGQEWTAYPRTLTGAGHAATCACMMRAFPQQAEQFPDIIMRRYRTQGQFNMTVYFGAIGPCRLGICELGNWGQLVMGEAAHGHAWTGDMPPMSSARLLAYSLSHWYLINRMGLPPPFTSLPASAALAGAYALVPADDATTRAEITRLTLVDDVAPKDATSFTQKLSRWRTGESETDGSYLNRRSRLTGSDAPADVHDNYTAADLPALVTALADMHPSLWVVHGHVRLIADQALRGIASVLAFDPRWLIGHNPYAPWTEQERSEVTSALTAWWQANKQRSIEEIRISALAKMDWLGISYLLKMAPDQEAAPLYSKVAQMWKAGPPHDFDDADLLARGAAFPDFEAGVMHWPVTGPQAQLLARWHLQHGDVAAFNGFLDDLLAHAVLEKYSIPVGDALFMLAGDPQTDAIAHVQQLLARIPMTPSCECLIRTCIYNERHIGTGRSIVLDTLLLGYVLEDDRLAPPGLAAWANTLSKSYFMSNGTVTKQETSHTVLPDLRICDCAASQMQKCYNAMTSYNKDKELSWNSLVFSLADSKQARNRKVNEFSRLLHEMLPNMLEQNGIHAALPPVSALPEEQETSDF